MSYAQINRCPNPACAFGYNGYAVYRCKNKRCTGGADKKPFKGCVKGGILGTYGGCWTAVECPYCGTEGEKYAIIRK
jgi:hypothetical protein